MSDNGQFDAVALQARDSLSRLHRPVMAGIERGLERARDYFEGREFDPHLHAHIVRDYAAEELRRSEQSVGFKLERRPLAGLSISFRGYVLKIWKKHGESLLQPPGHSEPRQEFLHQPIQPFLAIPQIETWVRNPTKLVYVWSSDNGVVDLSLVCPKNFDEDNLWQPGESHWDIRIEHPANELAPDVDFASDDEELPINLDRAGSGFDPDDDQ